MEINEKLVAAKKVVGLKISTSNTLESDPETARIPALWQRFFSESVEEQIPHIIEEGVLLGVYTDYDNEQRGHFALIAGRQVSALGALPEDFTAIEIPEGLYLVFSDEGDMPTIIYTTWHTIREYFSNTTDYVRTYTADFEFYDDDNPARIEIYIAVKK
ncbi:MAG TPA: GyrI-like domain-containing protein [Gammaproteobacteria bacterium]